MLIRIISLVILLTFYSSLNLFAENNGFIYPKAKPSVFKAKPKFDLTQKKVSLPKKKPSDSNKITELKKTNLKKANEEQNVKITINKNKFSFLLPKKKPNSYKKVSKPIDKSLILSQKDFLKAKIAIKYVKEKKWNSAIKASEKVKDSDFRNLILWMYLKNNH